MLCPFPGHPPVERSPFYTKRQGDLLPSGQNVRLKELKTLKPEDLGFDPQGGVLLLVVLVLCWCCCCWCFAGSGAAAGDAVAVAAGSGAAAAARVPKILGFKDCRINYQPMNYHRNAIKIP